LKKSAVTGSKLKPNAVSSAKVADGSLQRADFASGTLLERPCRRRGHGLHRPAQGNTSAMADQDHLLCAADEYHVYTTRIPSTAPVSGGTANTAAVRSDTVAFWLLVP
jgi:hypothetical protein